MTTVFAFHPWSVGKSGPGRSGAVSFLRDAGASVAAEELPRPGAHLRQNERDRLEGVGDETLSFEKVTN